MLHYNILVYSVIFGSDTNCPTQMQLPYLSEYELFISKLLCILQG
jgi:hypothetical protein